MNSKQKLAQALKEANAPVDFIQRALDGYYSDYDSPLETPCIQLIKDLDEAHLWRVKKRALCGDFDATKAESDAWWKRAGRALAIEHGIPLDGMEDK